MPTSQPYRIPIGKSIPIVLTGIVLFSFCINLHNYYYLSLQFYFAFTLCAMLISGIVALWRWGAMDRLHLTPSSLLMVAWGIWIAVHSQWVVSADSYQLGYLLSGIMYFLALSWLFRREKISFERIYALFAWMAVVQAMICLLQFTGILHSNDANYAIKGTLNNPNITAMYMAVCSPYFISGILRKRRIGICVASLVAIAAAIVLLQCRTAYVGLVVVGLVYAVKTERIRRGWQDLTVAARVLLLTGALSLLAGMFTVLYFQKKASADGRVFVWKVSLEMIREHPVRGYGYGLFEREYNLAQAHYIGTHETTVAEREHARYVFMPYNDLMEEAIQGGVTGLLLFGLMLGRLVWLAYRHRDARRAGVVMAFAAMMLVNFAVQAIVVWMLFLTAAAALCADERSLRVIDDRRVIKWGSLICLGVPVLLGASLLRWEGAQEQLQTGVRLYESGQMRRALATLGKSLDDAGTSEAYLRRYGGMLIHDGQTEKGCRVLEKAACYSSTPSLQFDLAIGYARQGQMDKAKERLKLVQNMVPTEKRVRTILAQISAAPLHRHTATPPMYRRRAWRYPGILR